MFDTFGEYHSAFKDINEKNSNYNFKFYSTASEATPRERLRIPMWLFEC